MFLMEGLSDRAKLRIMQVLFLLSALALGLSVGHYKREADMWRAERNEWRERWMEAAHLARFDVSQIPDSCLITGRVYFYADSVAPNPEYQMEEGHP